MKNCKIKMAIKTTDKMIQELITKKILYLTIEKNEQNVDIITRFRKAMEIIQNQKRVELYPYYDWVLKTFKTITKDMRLTEQRILMQYLLRKLLSYKFELNHSLLSYYYKMIEKLEPKYVPFDDFTVKFIFKSQFDSKYHVFLYNIHTEQPFSFVADNIKEAKKIKGSEIYLRNPKAHSYIRHRRIIDGKLYVSLVEDPLVSRRVYILPPIIDSFLRRNWDSGIIVYENPNQYNNLIKEMLHGKIYTSWNKLSSLRMIEVPETLKKYVCIITGFGDYIFPINYIPFYQSLHHRTYEDVVKNLIMVFNEDCKYYPWHS